MKYLKKGNLAIYSILMSLLLIINVLLGLLLGMQSGSSLKEQINSRMLDIAKTAAAMINGDDLRDIRKEDKGTEKYDNIMSVLNYFRVYTDLQYIYCVKKTENGKFIFTLDTDPDDPGEYGDPVEYTDALHKASLGTAAADDDFYVDRWGSFYSAYCPVLDSDGKVGGIIAVDYNKEWYDKQMDSQMHTTIIVVAISFIIGTLIIAIMSVIASKRRRMNEHLSQQLSSTADIYIAMYEIDLLTNTFNEVRSHNARISQMTGGSTDCQELISRLMEAFVDNAMREKMLDFADLSMLDRRLKEHSTITEEFLSADGKWCKARFIVSERLSDDIISNVMFIVEDIDDEKRSRDMVFDTAQHLSFQLRSIAEIYNSVHDIDMINDSYVEISVNDMMVSNTLGSNVGNAQQRLKNAVSELTHELYRADMLNFVDFSNIKRNIAENGIATLEFLNSRNVWCRSRFILSELTDDGRISHVLWAVENIDKEHREREKLRDISDRAVAANEAKTFLLSNMSREIRMPVNAVLGLNEMILNECRDDSIIEYAEAIKKEGASLLNFLDDVLDFSNIEEGKIKIVPVNYDLSLLLDDLVEIVKPETDSKGLRLSIDVNDAMPKYLYGDEAHIIQVLTNLLSNAVKYTDTGEVKLSIHYKKVAAEPDTIMLMVSVKDTGVGIKPEDMEKLFSSSGRTDMNNTSKTSVSGLGIKITRNLLEIMGSELEAESIYGKGSTFSFVLKQKVVRWDTIGEYRAIHETLPEETVETYTEPIPDETAAPQTDTVKAEPVPEDNTVIPEFIYGISDINTYVGIRNCGGKEAFVQTLGVFAAEIDGHITDIQRFYGANDMPGTIKKLCVLRAELSKIGAVILGDMALELENAGNSSDIMKLEYNMSSFLERCRYLSKLLTPLRYHA